MQKYLGLSGDSLVAAVTICSSAGFLLFGYDQGVMSGVVGYPNNYFAIDFNNPDATMTGLIVAIYEIGCFLGALCVFLIGEYLGRRKCILLGGTILILGTILQCSSFEVSQFHHLQIL